jgi:hypothetical protein
MLLAARGVPPRELSELDLVGDDVGGAVVAGEHFVGFGGAGAGEAFGFGVHREDGAEGEVLFLEVDFVAFEVFDHAAEAFGGFFVGLDAFLDFVGGVFLAEAIGNVSGVAEGAGKMAFEDVGVQVFLAAAADGFEEVLEMIGAAFEVFDFLVVFVVNGAAVVARDGNPAVFAFDDDADAGAFIDVHFLDEEFGFLAGGGSIRFFGGGFLGFFHFLLGEGVVREAADFEDQRRFVIHVENDLGVGRGAVIDVTDPSAEAHDFGRKMIDAEGPAGDVHLMDALVAEIAAAGGPDPMPIVMEILAHEGLHRGRTAPDVVINARGNGLGAGDFADAGAAFVAKAAREENFAEGAAVDVFDDFAHARVGAGLGAGLDDFAVGTRGFDDFAAFPNVVGNRLFAINIFAGLNGPDGGEGMPVIRRGDADDVEVFFLEEFADVAEGFDGGSGFGGTVGGGFFGIFLNAREAFAHDIFVHVAKGDHAGAGGFAEAIDVGFAAAVEADGGDADVAVGAGDLGPGFGGETGGGRGEGGFGEETATSDFHKSIEFNLDLGFRGDIHQNGAGGQSSKVSIVQRFDGCDLICRSAIKLRRINSKT